jgi:hypothetical protein
MLDCACSEVWRWCRLTAAVWSRMHVMARSIDPRIEQATATGVLLDSSRLSLP